jgi:plasmid stability protein
MRTIVTLDDELHRRAKAYAAEHGLTLAALVQEALRARLAKARGRRARVVLPTFKGNGLQPGVNLDDMRTVYDAMDGTSS